MSVTKKIILLGMVILAVLGARGYLWMMERSNAAKDVQNDPKKNGLKVDLVADYRVLLKELGKARTPEEADKFDTGEILYEDKGNGLQELCFPDGVPEITVPALLNAVLAWKGLKIGDLTQTEVVENYEKNLALAEKLLPMAPPAVQRAVTAIMISSDYDLSTCLGKAIQQKYGVNAAKAGFHNPYSTQFGVDGNVDGDPHKNREEWAAALKESGTDAPIDKVLDCFVKKALTAEH